MTFESKPSADRSGNRPGEQDDERENTNTREHREHDTANDHADLPTTATLAKLMTGSERALEPVENPVE